MSFRNTLVAGAQTRPQRSHHASRRSPPICGGDQRQAITGNRSTGSLGKITACFTRLHGQCLVEQGASQCRVRLNSRLPIVNSWLLLANPAIRQLRQAASNTRAPASSRFLAVRKSSAGGTFARNPAQRLYGSPLLLWADIFVSGDQQRRRPLVIWGAHG